MYNIFSTIIHHTLTGGPLALSSWNDSVEGRGCACKEKEMTLPYIHLKSQNWIDTTKQT